VHYLCRDAETNYADIDLLRHVVCGFKKFPEYTDVPATSPAWGFEKGSDSTDQTLKHHPQLAKKHEKAWFCAMAVPPSPPVERG
jgi:hypothetical protein